MRFPDLFTPIIMGGVEIKNRIVLAPMGIGSYNSDETPTDEYTSFLKARSRETGLIITTGARASWRYGKLTLLGCNRDEQIPGLRRLTKAVHGEGAKIFIQLLVLGGADFLDPCVPSVDVSKYQEEWEGEARPKELRTAQIHEVVRDFIAAAKRAREAGFDGVELDGAENFLVSDFITPGYNRRPDEYGGSFENRMRFPVEVVEGIRKLCGGDFPVGFKFNAFYDVPDGIDLNLGLKIAGRMAEAGAAYIHGWSFAQPDRPMSLFRYPPMPNLYQERNTTLPISRHLKTNLPRVPIIAVGGILKPDEADRIIAEGIADLIAVGRGFIADPLWAYKAKTGGRIRPCIRCHVCHHEVAVRERIVVCSVNPDVLQESEEQKAEKVKHVLVAGGGPGGIVAAVTAAKRGHHVRLYEKEGVVGGKLIPGSRPEFKREYKDLLKFFQDELGESRVGIVTGCELTPSLVQKESPDVLIIAIGAMAVLPEITGMKTGEVITAIEALNDFRRLEGKRVAVIGGGDVGCETALHLTLNGSKVTIVEQLDELMTEEEIKYNTVVLEKLLNQEGVEVLTGARVIELSGNNHMVVQTEAGHQTLSADIVIIASGYRASSREVDALSASCKSGYPLGDCVQPGRLRHAVSEGFRIGNLI